MNGAAALQDILKSFIRQGSTIVAVLEAENQYVIVTDKKQSRPKAETR
tara:strand:- start:293 stop:436 length:144 start_codon:yes stop_codon:yes gene_type:complete